MMKFKIKGICVNICPDTPTNKLEQFKRICEQEVLTELDAHKKQFLEWLLEKTNNELTVRNVYDIVEF